MIRDSFLFSIKRMPYLESNITSRIFYSSLGAEILRTRRAKNTNSTFYNADKTTIQCMVKHGGKLNIINKTLVFGQRCDVFKKFAVTSEHFVQHSKTTTITVGNLLNNLLTKDTKTRSKTTAPPTKAS